MNVDYYREYFRREEHYWWFVARRRITVSLLDRYVRPGSGRTILDIGTGTGVMLDTLARYGTATGVDFSEQALAFCRLRGKSNVVRSRGEALPFPSESVDLVCAMDVLEHIADDRDAVNEWRRVLRPGGLLFLTVPAHRFLWGPHDEINMHRRRYHRRRLAGVVRSAGLAVERLSYFNCLLFPLVTVVRLAHTLLRGSRSGARSDLVTVPPLVNALLEKIFASERFFLSAADLPVGVSLLCIARK